VNATHAAGADPAAESGTQPLEIACDESGSEGLKLIAGSTDVFAHASVNIEVAAAEACIARVRVDARSPATEVKASVVLRERNRRVLEWLLGPAGPLYGRARVHLTEKVFRLVLALVDYFAEPGGPATNVSPQGRRALALTLYREGPAALEPAVWRDLLGAFNDVARVRARESSSGTAQALSRHLDPLFPALSAAIAYWASAGRPLSIVHDQQVSLTPERVRQVTVASDNGSHPGPGTSLRLVDSLADPRVQVADFLAGAARRIASEELNGRGDTTLTALLRPYVDPASIWGDAVSWARLDPSQESPGAAQGRGLSTSAYDSM
jgi:hypothetical protein